MILYIVHPSAKVEADAEEEEAIRLTWAPDIKQSLPSEDGPLIALALGILHNQTIPQVQTVPY